MKSPAVRLLLRSDRRTKASHIVFAIKRNCIENSVAHRVAVLSCLVAVMISSTALAQTTGALGSSSPQAEPTGNGDVPLGGCMPIGLTASGEMVFPILCKEFIELHREKSVEQKPAVEEQNVTAAPEETVARDEGAVPESTSAIDMSNRTDASPKIKYELRQQRATNQDGCQHYRTYDAASETYRSYDGRRRSCR